MCRVTPGALREATSSALGSYRSSMEDLQAPVLTRVVVFLAMLALVAVAGWTAGRVAGPAVPVPVLPRPAVLGGPGQAGSPEAGAEPGAGLPGPIAPIHGGGHAG